MVVVDHIIGFLGGIDLCYGRMDNEKHLIVEKLDLDNQKQELFWPGIDYYNARIHDYLEVQSFGSCSIDRRNQPRMPWHDIGLKVYGEVVQDMAKHFIQYWNFVQVDALYYQKQGNLKNIPKLTQTHLYEVW